MRKQAGAVFVEAAIVMFPVLLTVFFLVDSTLYLINHSATTHVAATVTRDLAALLGGNAERNRSVTNSPNCAQIATDISLAIRQYHCASLALTAGSSYTAAVKHPLTGSNFPIISITVTKAVDLGRVGGSFWPASVSSTSQLILETRNHSCSGANAQETISVTPTC